MKQELLLDYLAKHYSSTSYQGYYNQIKRFLLVVSLKNPKLVQERDILDYLNLLRQQGLHPKSLRNNLYAIKLYYTYLLETGQVKRHPCKYLYLKDPINKQIVVEELYSQDDLQELYTHWQSKTKANQIRDKLIVSFLIYQALTTSELSNIQVKDINLEQGLIDIKSTGQNISRKLALNPAQVYTLLEYLQTRQSSNPYLLLNKYNQKLWAGAINRILNQNRTSSNRISAMKIRQSVIYHLLKQNKDIRIVQAFAGHRRVSSTESYKQTGLEELKFAIDRLHPLG